MRPDRYQEPISTRRLRLCEPALEARAYLDRGCKISGKLVFEDAVRIDGQVEGEILARDSLIVGESAVLMHRINAAWIIVAGTVSGEVNASRGIEIRSSAKVSGTITTPNLIVHEGASFDGYCATPGDSVLKEPNAIEPVDERRAPLSSPPSIAAPSVVAERFNLSNQAQGETERDRLMNFFSSISDALLLLGPEGTIVFANEEAEGCLGLPAGGLANGKSLEALLGGANALVRIVNTALTAETGLNDVAIKLGDGAGCVHFLVSIFIIGRNPAGATLLVILRDLAPVRELRAEREEIGRLDRAIEALSPPAQSQAPEPSAKTTI